MTFLDWVLLLLVGAGLAQGYASGLLRQIASVVGIVAALAFAMALMEDVGLIAAKSLGLSPRVAPVVGFLLVFAAVQVAVFALVRMAETVVGAFRLTFVNRLGGAALGAFKAALLMSVVLLPLASLGVPKAEARRDSLLYEPIARLMPQVWDVVADQVPRMDGVRQQFDAAARALRHRLPGVPPDSE